MPKETNSMQFSAFLDMKKIEKNEQKTINFHNILLQCYYSVKRSRIQAT